MTIGGAGIRLLTCLALGLAILVPAGCGGGSPGGDAAVTGDRDQERSTYEISGLHPVYGGLDDLSAAADLIAVGKPTAIQVVEAESIEDDPDGAPLSGLPVTEYEFFVEQVDKGPSGLQGETITVRVLGGETENGSYVVEGRVPLAVGSTYLLFLAAGEDELYYPLAGDGAAAARTASGDYALPPEVIGAEGATIPAQAIEQDNLGSTPPPSGGPVAAAAAAPPAAVRAPSVKGVRALVRRGVAKLSLACPDNAAPCTGTVAALTGRRKPRRLAAARYSIAPGQAQVLALRLAARGRRLLLAAPPRGLKVKLQLDPDGPTKSATRALTLRLAG
jgi:hypothetical protein